MSYPNLSKSPIQVAIIEIRYSWLPPEKDGAAFVSLAPFVKNELPLIEKGDHKNIDLQELPDGSIKSTVTHHFIPNYKFLSGDRKNVLLVATERFNMTFSSNYQSWDYFFGLFWSYWKAFINTVITLDKIKITGISIRTINKIETAQLSDTTEYFNTTIYADEGVIPGNVNNYLMRYTINMPDDNVYAVVSQGLDDVNSGSYLFDIDVLNNHVNNTSDLGKYFEILHELKNKIFFNNITAKTLSLLQ